MSPSLGAWGVTAAELVSGRRNRRRRRTAKSEAAGNASPSRKVNSEAAATSMARVGRTVYGALGYGRQPDRFRAIMEGGRLSFDLGEDRQVPLGRGRAWRFFFVGRGRGDEVLIIRWF